jgi:hypothetical protein
MNATIKVIVRKLAPVAMLFGAAIPSYAVICYGNAQQVSYEYSPGLFARVDCDLLTSAPSGSTYQNYSCWYIFCDTSITCTQGPNYQATKRFRQVWVNPSIWPYLFTQGSPSDVKYGCCTCDPYTQTTEPPPPD